MRFGIRSLQACVLLASAAAAAFAAPPSSAAAGSGAAQQAVAPSGPAGEQGVQGAVAPGGKTARSINSLAPAVSAGKTASSPATPAIGVLNLLAPVQQPPVAPSSNLGPPPTAFFTIVPCRVFDTRLPADAPALTNGVVRNIQITGNCGIPTSATQVAINATVTQQTAVGGIQIYPGDASPPGVSFTQLPNLATRANNGVMPLSQNGDGTINVILNMAPGTDTAHFFVDLNGYFAVVNPIAVDDSYHTTLNTALNQPAPGVLANDTLSGGAIFSYGASTGGEQTTIGAATPTSAGGSISLNANGSFNYTPATSFEGSDTFKYVLKNAFGSSTATVTIAVGKGNQTITVTSTAPAGATVGGPTYDVTATASSGLPVTCTIDASASSVCSISGSTVSFLHPGTCIIDCNQAGDANWNPAPQVQQTFAVGKGNQTITFTSTAPAGAVVGGPTYNVMATASSGLPVTFTIDASAAAVCSISGSTVSFTAAGTCVIDANQAGDADWNPAPQAQQTFPVGKGSQTITFTSTPPASAQVGGPTYTVTATASSGLPVTFTIDASASSVCSISGSTVSFIGNGTCVIDANQAGDANWNPAPQAQQPVPVGKGDQTITFTSTAPASAKVGGPTYTVTATASSGLPVTFTIDASASSVCSISGSTVSFTAVGTCVIDANQAGDANWNPAPQMQQPVAVAKGDQTITFTSTAPAGAKVGGPTYTVTATASSGLTVTFTIDASASSVCSISGSTVSFIGAGTCVIDANQAGNANWNPAPQAQQPFPVAKGDQTITFTSSAPVGAKVGGPTYTVTATASSGLPVTFTIDPSASSVCSISGSTVSFTAGGICVIDANQAGNANFNAAPQVQQSFAVAKADQTITFTSTPPATAKIGDTYTVSATASSGLTVTFTIDASATSVCSVSGSLVTFNAGGSCVIDANQAGNASFNAAPQVQQSVYVNMPPQPIASPKENFDTVGNTQFEFRAAQSLPVSVFVAGNLVANFTDSDGPNPLSAVAISGGATTNGGTVDLATNGEFTFTPKAGDAAASDTFQYQVTDGLYVVTRTVTINLKSRVWYEKNNAPGGGSGRSHQPFNTLAAAEAASSAGDYIFVYGGDLTTTGQAAGITLQANQKLYGEAFGLTIANTINGVANPTLVAANAGNRPLIDNTAAASDGVTALNISGVEVRGLSVGATRHAINVTTTATNSGGATITNNVIRLPGNDGIHAAAGGSGTMTLAIQSNTITGNTNGINVQKTAGTLYITAFNDNTVSGSTPGSGIVVSGAIFDATPTGSIQTVSGGSTMIGVSGDGVGASGMLLSNVVGDLSFTNFGIYNSAGTGLLVSSTGALNAGAGTGFRITVGAGVGTIASVGGPALDVSGASVTLPLNSLTSSNSTTTGVSLVNAFGGVGSTAFSVSSGSITDPGGASGTAFNVNGGTGNVTLGIPITNSSGNSVTVSNRTGDTVSFSSTITDTGSGISLTSNTGATISFTGALSLTTGANPGFTATGGGTVTATNTTSTVTTTTGTAVNVANTTIGAAGIKWKSVSAGTAASGPANGIVLNSTGAGVMTVAGDGSTNSCKSGTTTCSGGTIQKTTGDAISLTSTKVNLSLMWIKNNANSGIKGTTVSAFTLTDCLLQSNTNSTGEQAGILLNDLSDSNAQVTRAEVSGSTEDNVRVHNTSTTGTITFSNCTVKDNSTGSGNNGIFLQTNTTGNLTGTVQNSTLSGNRAIALSADSGDGSTLSATFAGNTVTAGSPNQGNQGIQVSRASTSTLTFNVNNNTVNGMISTLINVFSGSGPGTGTGDVKNNVCTGTGVGGNQVGIRVFNSGTSAVGQGTINANVANNTVTNIDNAYGIMGESSNSSGSGGQLKIAVTGNNVSVASGGTALDSIRVQARNTSSVCAKVSGNTTNSGGPGFYGIQVRQANTSTFDLEGLTTGPQVEPTVHNFLVAQNPAAATVSSDGSVTGTITGVAVGSCGITP
jgi:hypothetical protein